MGHGYQGIRFDNLLADIYLLEVLEVNRYGGLGFSPQAIRNHQGRIHHRVCKPVLDGGDEMGGGVTARPGVEGVGIGQKRLAAFRGNGFYYFP